MKPPSLRRLLQETDTEILLAQFARLADGPLTLAIFDRQSRALASFPAGEHDELAAAAAAVRRTGQPLVNHASRALPILAGEQLVGVLVGTPSSAAGLDDVMNGALSILAILLNQAMEKKALAQELLERYREINLLYRLHETIGAHIDLQDVAGHALAESVRIVRADGGALFLYIEETRQLRLLATEGDTPDLSVIQGILEWAAQEGRSAIVNDVAGDPRYRANDALRLARGQEPIKAPALESLLCAPLKVRQKVLGILCLCNKQGGIFTAGDEKLLVALASQTAVAVENAQQVAAREQRLWQQIQELRIEIDEVKKRQAVKTIVDSDYFRQLAETAQQLREDFSRG
jgi:GAF domain-containing protein